MLVAYSLVRIKRTTKYSSYVAKVSILFDQRTHTTLSMTWVVLKDHPVYRTRFQNQVFPEKVGFNGKKFGTKKMSLVYELNQPNADKNSDLVTQVSQNWNQLYKELRAWHTFGRNLERNGA